MAVKKVKKIVIFGVDDKKEEALSELQKAGFLHIIPAEKDARSEDQSAKMKTALLKTELVLDFLEKEANESMFAKLKPVYVSEEEFFVEQERNLEKNIKWVEGIWSKIQKKDELSSTLQDTKVLLDELEPWKNVEISFDDFKSQKYTTTILGKMPYRFYEQARDEHRSSKAFTYVEPSYLAEDSAGYVYVSVILLKEDKEKFLEESRAYGFEEYEPQLESKSLTEEYEAYQNKVKSLNEEIEELSKEILVNVKDISKLKLFYDYLSNVYDKVSVNKEMTDTSYTFQVFAWISEEDIPGLEKLIDKVGYLDWEEVELKEGEVAPVQIENDGFSEPFEFVTDMYSRPGKNDPDPTPILAPFFAIFYAMCLTDAGYGLIMAVFGFLALKKFRFSESMKKLVKLISISGAFTVVIGLLTGGIFGIDASLLKEGNPLRQFIESVRLFNPTGKVGMGVFMLVCLGFGYLHVILGYFVDFFYKLKIKMAKEAFLDALPVILVMLGVLPLAINFLVPMFLKDTVVNAPLVTPGIYLALAGIVLIFLFSGRTMADGIVGQLIWGIKGVYDLTGLLGDVLSYFRLFALGLATGLIGGVVNKLATDVLGKLSFDGVSAIIGSVLSIIGFIVILVAGHIYNLLMNALGAFIHTMRLQFVEFFTKFFEGGGEAFNPFKIKLKYFLIKNKK